MRCLSWHSHGGASYVRNSAWQQWLCLLWFCRQRRKTGANLSFTQRRPFNFAWERYLNLHTGAAQPSRPQPKILVSIYAWAPYAAILADPGSEGLMEVQTRTS